MDIGNCKMIWDHAKTRRREEQVEQDLQDGTIGNWKMYRSREGAETQRTG